MDVTYTWITSHLIHTGRRYSAGHPPEWRSTQMPFMLIGMLIELVSLQIKLVLSTAKIVRNLLPI